MAVLLNIRFHTPDVQQLIPAPCTSITTYSSVHKPTALMHKAPAPLFGICPTAPQPYLGERSNAARWLAEIVRALHPIAGLPVWAKFDVGFNSSSSSFWASRQHDIGWIVFLGSMLETECMDGVQYLGPWTSDVLSTRLHPVYWKCLCLVPWTSQKGSNPEQDMFLDQKVYKKQQGFPQPGFVRPCALPINSKNQ